MNWANKNVLVTGGGGFIGSHLLERLVALKANVRTFIRYNSRNDMGLIELLPPLVQNSVEVIASDLRDYPSVWDAMREVEVVFHLAALISIPYSYKYPGNVVENNIRATQNVLQAARECAVGKFVHTSSSEVYGTAEYTPIDEKHPLKAQSPYAASKTGCDQLALSFYYSYELPVTIIRPFNTYGPRQSARAIVPTIITQALTQKQVFLGSLTPTRDLTYITDIVDGFIKVAEGEDALGEVFNIGSGREISVGDLADRIVNLINPGLQITFDASRIRPEKSEVEQLICNASKAKQRLGWEPKVSLEEGLKQTMGWIKEYIALYKPCPYNI